MMNEKTMNLKLFANEIRIATMEQFKARGFGHAGGSLSIAETLAVLYGEVMALKPNDKDWEGRDRFVLSKGHAGPALYATLALKGYFDREVLKTLNQPGTTLPSHPDRNKTPGVDMSTGSLGQGISQAVGLALGFKLKDKGNRVYCIIGDGESNEGQVWEAILFAGHRELDNLIVFVDDNGKQLDGYTDEICKMGDFAEKFRTFGWYAQTVDGHNVDEILAAVDKAKSIKGKPSVIVLKTLKGKGVKSIEDIYLNHHNIIAQEDSVEAIELLEEEAKRLRLFEEGKG